MNNPWRTALVIGLGKSGLAAIDLLLELGTAVRAHDRRSDASLPSSVVPYLGADEPPPEAFADLDLMVLSPGVPPERFRELCSRHAPEADIEGELGLALRWLRHRDHLGRLVLVTGTNGKSTVTAMIGHLLRAAGREPFVGGNLGDPLAERVAACERGQAPWPADLVIEASSFQLETLAPTPTEVGIVLNVTPDHLDRYPDLSSYAKTKAKVFDGLGTRGLAVLDADGEFTPAIAPANAALVGPGGRGYVEGEGAGRAMIVGDDPPYPRSLLRLSGRHNASNAVFALLAARHLGVTVQQCIAGLQTFEGLPHRMVFVRELDGVRYFNDSKATNVASALASLGGLDERFVLIAGGRGKGDDLGPLAQLLAQRGRGLVAIGESADQFHRLAPPGFPAAKTGDLVEAVAVARRMAEPGDAVVLAPACASFDQFRSYAHRGEVFTRAVLEL